MNCRHKLLFIEQGLQIQGESLGLIFLLKMYPFIMERVKIYTWQWQQSDFSLLFSIRSKETSPPLNSSTHSSPPFLITVRRDKWLPVVPISKPRPVLASRLSQYLNYLWFSAILIPSPTLNSSGPWDSLPQLLLSI